MRLRMLFLFPGIIHIVIQIFFTGAKATVNSGNLTLNSGEVLEINTTVPSVVKSPCSGCSFNASHQNRNSSHGDHLVAVIEFSGNIEFRSGSTVNVLGKYALSIASQNGHILIQTDINMTCGEKVFDTTCLGGFTQSSAAKSVGHPMVNLYKGLGPGGLTVKLPLKKFVLDKTCILGSSHGGTTSDTTANQYMYSGEAYDTQDIISLLGGSGDSRMWCRAMWVSGLQQTSDVNGKAFGTYISTHSGACCLTSWGMTTATTPNGLDASRRFTGPCLYDTRSNPEGLSGDGFMPMHHWLRDSSL